MSINRTIQLSIPRPCSQHWEGMPVNETGRFCDSCNKSVIDFTHFSDQQLADFFKKAKGNVCGKLRNDQLNKSLHPLQQTNSHSIPKFLISAALAIGLGNNAYSKEKLVHPTILQAAMDGENEAAENNPIAGSDSTRIISATVIDQATKETIPGVTVLIEGTTITTSTNINGFFQLDISSHLYADTIKLIISSIGYTTKIVKYAPVDVPSKSTIELTGDAQLILTSVGGIGYWKPTFRQRIKYWFIRKIRNNG
jgi:hypothetical protein